MTIPKQFSECKSHRKGRNQHMGSLAPVNKCYLTLTGSLLRALVEGRHLLLLLLHTHPAALKLWADWPSFLLKLEP